MAMDREQLAAQIYAYCYRRPSVRGEDPYYVTPKQSFRAADHFLKESERQRNQPEPPKCEHDWYASPEFPVGKCRRCSMLFNEAPKPEPAPKREAREFNIYVVDGQLKAEYADVWQFKYEGNKKPVLLCKAREVLND